MGRACAGGVQAEAAEEAETIQHLAAFGEMGNRFVIGLLIEIQTGLVPGDEIGLKFQAV